MIEHIDSPANKKIKLAAALKQRKQREKAGLFVAEGIRLCEMAAESDWSISFGLLTKQLTGQKRGQDLIQKLQARNCSLYEVTEQIFAKVANTDTPQGIILVMESQKQSLPQVEKTDALYVVMDGVQDPGNAGTIIRTADAVGADGVILLKDSVDVYADKVVRSTMGSIFHVPVYSGVTVADLLAFVQKNKLQLLATALNETAKPHFQQDFTKGTAVVLGNEGHGVSADLLAVAGKTYIPMFGQAESLNVGMSASIVLYEVVRQRKFS
ncbi:RNA methyltransferase, TrmH family [Selenomonas ruminantium]|uniref:RNA methyltransferase, TrmH family n=1 Tax=Selenomonas ruminantium TaxID=971 RepID=A0A1M6SHW1_SELRU|nr:RNA methyltransferase [Selenomonas ruminantium]SHK44229.1 RNA methyltransferase, TrmH family [Selenomonas ruminantium]